MTRPQQGRDATREKIPENALAYTMQLAAHVVNNVREQGQSLPAALTCVCPHHLAASTRGAVQDLSYLAMRQLAAANALIAQCVHHAPAPPLHYLLVIAFALLIDKKVRYTEFTVVDQAVEAVATQQSTRHGKGLVNAVLRQFLRKRAALTFHLTQTLSTHWNFPDWWITRLRHAYPDNWQHILEVSNQAPPMTLRINQSHHDLSHTQTQLAAAGIPTLVVGPMALQLVKPLPVQQLPGFAQGQFSVQDAGAQLAAPLLDIYDGMRVLDACAAPGGKTGHLLEMAGVHVHALELDPHRAQRIAENLARLPVHKNAQAHILVGDASQPHTWWDGQLFDRILADVPCSGSGIVRRHPDIRWLRRPEDIAALVQLQRNILLALWPLLAPGGKLLYATCSIFPEEGEQQAAWFEQTQTDAVRLRALGQLLPLSVAHEITDFCPTPLGVSPNITRDHDGFYYALFEKRLN
ncbi:MAG: 16S rRNA (cytosine(967)-C(5))-methyltransferase RsmB [Ottowia sp.]|nr:16S rRNA (cytosine(967)-C(5))-methyltransferase RsmB [Ottowia sp.]